MLSGNHKPQWAWFIRAWHKLNMLGISQVFLLKMLMSHLQNCVEGLFHLLSSLFFIKFPKYMNTPSLSSWVSQITWNKCSKSQRWQAFIHITSASSISSVCTELNCEQHGTGMRGTDCCLGWHRRRRCWSKWKRVEQQWQVLSWCERSWGKCGRSWNHTHGSYKWRRMLWCKCMYCQCDFGLCGQGRTCSVWQCICQLQLHIFTFTDVQVHKAGSKNMHSEDLNGTTGHKVCVLTVTDPLGSAWDWDSGVRGNTSDSSDMAEMTWKVHGSVSDVADLHTKLVLHTVHFLMCPQVWAGTVMVLVKILTQLEMQKPVPAR